MSHIRALPAALFCLLLIGCSETPPAESDQGGEKSAESADSAMVAAPADSAAPNILLIISDDFGLDVTSGMYPGMVEAMAARYGPEGLNHPDYQRIAGHPASTPVLDTLASQSLVFSNVYAHPFCSPTRASILTGLYGARTGVLSYADPLSQQHLSFVKLLHEQAGYRTGLFGKWHLSGLPGQEVSYPGIKPKEAGFDLFKGNLHAAITTYWDYDYQWQDADTPASQWESGAPPVKSLPGIAPTTFAPVVKVADTIDWISEQEAADPERPWFAWLAFNLSHATINQQPSAMAVPNADTLDAVSYQEMQECGGQFGSNNTGECSGEALMRAMTNAMDTVMGKLLAAIDDIDPNTYVIFIGDNGTPMYGRPNLDFIDNLYISRTGRGKGTAYESGARVPLAIHGPDIAPGRSEAIVHAADLFPTVLSMAGLDIPSMVSNSEGDGEVPLDAVSLAPLLADPGATVRDPDSGYLLTESLNLMTGGTEQVGARNATYKVVCTSGTTIGDCEFYDLAQDPLEEYPLQVPASCEAYTDGSLQADNPAWHYCHLTRVIDTQSFL